MYGFSPNSLNLWIKGTEMGWEVMVTFSINYIHGE